jgi:hypothetical protein
MAELNSQDRLARQVRIMQIIWAALLAGTLTLLVVAVIMVQTRGPLLPPGNPPIVSLLALGVSIAILAAWRMVPPMTVKAARWRIAQGQWSPPGPQYGRAAPMPATDAEKLLHVYQTQLLIGMALLEGAAFFASIAYWQEGAAWVLGLAIALCLLLALQFPTRIRVEQWLEEQLVLLEQARQVTGG